MLNSLSANFATAWIAAFVLVAVGQVSSAIQIIPPPVEVVASSEFSPDFVVGNLFDVPDHRFPENPQGFGQVFSAWGGRGDGPDQVYMDFGETITANRMGHAQRTLNPDPIWDKVSEIQLWFGESEFGQLPAAEPDAVVAGLRTHNGRFQVYDLNGTFSGRYVAANFIRGDFPGTGGGAEFRLLFEEDSADLPGDMDCDGVLDFDDIPPLVQGLRDPALYETQYGTPSATKGDLDGDGDLDFDDIPLFVDLLRGGEVQQVAQSSSAQLGMENVPEPSSLVLALSALALGNLTVRRQHGSPFSS